MWTTSPLIIITKFIILSWILSTLVIPPLVLFFTKFPVVSNHSNHSNKDKVPLKILKKITHSFTSVPEISSISLSHFFYYTRYNLSFILPSTSICILLKSPPLLFSTFNSISTEEVAELIFSVNKTFSLSEIFLSYLVSNIFHIIFSLINLIFNSSHHCETALSSFKLAYVKTLLKNLIVINIWHHPTHRCHCSFFFLYKILERIVIS